MMGQIPISKNFTFPKIKPTSNPTFIQDSSPISYISPQYQTYNCYSFATKSQIFPENIKSYKIPESLSILTYNIWFQSHNIVNRLPNILKILQSSNADFICLQQVTKQFTNLLHKQNSNGWISKYFVSVIPMQWYDTLILTKYQCRFYKLPFRKTMMTRSALLAEILIENGKNIIVGSVHYESMDSQKLREMQIQDIQNYTQKCERVIIVGDYNFSDNAPQNQVVSKQYVDLWLKVKGNSEQSFTMAKTNSFSSWRPDHILCKLPNNKLQGAQIQIIGKFTIKPYENDSYKQVEKDGQIRTPSDHFGLISWIPIL